MVSIDAKEKMGDYLMEKYGEAFTISHIDSNESSISGNVIYSSDVWPELRPEVVFRCTLDRATDELLDNYPEMDLAFRSKSEAIDAFEAQTSSKIASLRQLMFPVPYGHEVTLGDSLDETFSKNPGEVSLLLHAFVETSDVDADAIVGGMRGFIDGYVRRRGYNYLTLRIWYMAGASLARYKEDLEEGWEPYDPPSEMCSAVFTLVMKVSRIDSGELSNHLAIS